MRRLGIANFAALIVVGVGSACTDDEPMHDAGGADVGRQDIGRMDTGTSEAGTDAQIDSGVPPITRFRVGFSEAFTGTDYEVEVCVPALNEPCKTQLSDSTTTWAIPIGAKVYATASAANVFTTVLPIDNPNTDRLLTEMPLFELASLRANALASGVTLADGSGHVAFLTEGGDNPASLGVTIVAVGQAAEARYLDRQNRFDEGLTATSSHSPAGFVFNLAPGPHEFEIVHPRNACRVESYTGWLNAAGTAFVAEVLSDAVTFLLVRCDIDECDWIEQGCPDVGDKCRMHLFPDENGRQWPDTSCVPAGERALLESCLRPSDDAGDDDCAEGLYCSHSGLARGVPQARQCLQACDAERPECLAGFGCRSFAVSFDAPGQCVGLCDPFGDDCTPGTHCVMFGEAASSYPGIFNCEFDGLSNEGDPCATSADCIAPFGCFSPDAQTPARCVEYCDSTHACPGGETCARFVGIQGIAEFGTCP